ncbi:hypothetical protein D3C76_1687880 [compost metagenome]
MSIMVPSGTMFHTSRMSRFVMAMQPSVQSRVWNTSSGYSSLRGVPWIMIIPPGGTPSRRARAASLMFG